MKNRILFLILFLAAGFRVFPQVGINSDGTNPDPAAMLDVKSVNKGFLPPRMTAAQMSEILLPPSGLLVYNTTVNSLYWFNGLIWKRFNESSYTETDPVFTAHAANGIATTDIDNWNIAFASRVTTATGLAPLSLSINNHQLSGFMTPAGAAASGYLTANDWNLFKNKQDALVFGNVTAPDMTVTGGTNAVVGGGLSLAINKANLTSSDITVNGGTGSVLGSGTTLTLKKGNLTETGSGVLTITSGTNVVLGTGTTIQVKQAGAGVSGYLTAADWSSFNNKVSSPWLSNGDKVYYNAGNVGVGTSNPEASAALDIAGSDKGFLLPRLTFAQRNAISNPAQGLLVICTDGTPEGTTTLSVFMGGQWLNISGNCAIPVSPVSGIQAQSNTQIVWNWNAAPIAAGYKWNTAADYASALNVGAVTSKTETGLTPGNSYTRYVWAYNGCGHSEPVVLTGQALSCGSAFTRTHTMGPVAPETKTVNYGTVENIPGETAKCWITRNLGATQQANTANDNTEAAAGWYWQFNRQTGYKHDGTSSTPAWTITSISENSNWTAMNDPCNIELGAVWRLPTQTEWFNVDATGGWTNLTAAWNSGLQLHASGTIYYTNGNLNYRGTYGYFWSSTAANASNASYLTMNSYWCEMSSSSKASGHALRCLRP